MIAAMQTAGRGRRGRRWIAPEGSGLHLSLRLRPTTIHPTTRWTFLTAVAATDACQQSGATGTMIKWPNDLWIGRQKLGGILVEIKSSASRPPNVMIGLGINVHSEAAELQELGLDDATSLREACPDSMLSRSRLAADFLQEFDRRLRQLDGEQGWSKLREAWLRRAPMAQGQKVRLLEQGAETTGATTDGIDDEGALRVRLDDGSIRRVLQVESVRYED